VCPVCNDDRIILIHPADKGDLLRGKIGVNCPHKDSIYTWVRLKENAFEIPRIALSASLKSASNKVLLDLNGSLKQRVLCVVLPDVLKPNLKVVFCGTTAGDRSAKVGAYYAGPGNQFWAVLARTGMTPRQLKPEEYSILPRYGIGLTDLAKGTHGSDARISTSEFDIGGFRKRIEKFRPQVVAFNGKRSAEVLLDRSVKYGHQPEDIHGTAVFVLPSTSGAARGYWDERYWKELSVFMAALLKSEHAV
jgi:TDG/mug DNA glycosylase family protein